MKVEIELDELCELRREAEKNRTWDYNRVCLDTAYARIKRLKAELAAYEPEDHETNWVPVAEHKDYVDRSRKQVCKLNDVVLELSKERDRWKKLSINTAKAADAREVELMDVLSCNPATRHETWEHALRAVAKVFRVNAD